MTTVLGAVTSFNKDRKRSELEVGGFSEKCSMPRESHAQKKGSMNSIPQASSKIGVARIEVWEQ